jgi:hypothetical protein
MTTPKIRRKGESAVWPGFDPELQRQLEHVRTMAKLSQQSPTKEWPLIFVEEHDELLVIREWPGGAITAYSTSDYSDRIRGQR